MQVTMCVWKQNNSLSQTSVRSTSIPNPEWRPLHSPTHVTHDRVSFFSFPHLLEDYDTPGEEEAALPLITGDNTMRSYV